MVKLSLPAKFGDLFKPARYKAFYGGRGSAKSHSFATALLMQAGKEPLRVLCGREVQLSIKDSVKQLLDDKISQLGMEGFYESTQHEIRGRNGSLFWGCFGPSAGRVTRPGERVSREPASQEPTTPAALTTAARQEK